MRRFIFIILLAIPLMTKAQIEVFNTSLNDSSLHVVYKFQNNYIKVYGFSDYSKIRLILGNNEYKSDNGSNKFVIEFDDGKEDTDTLKILQQDNLVFYCPVKISQLPQYKIICGISADTVKSVDELLSFPYLQAILPNCDFKCGLRIVRFSVSFYLNNLDLQKLKPLRTKDYLIKCKKTNKKIIEAKTTERFMLIERVKSQIEINLSDSLTLIQRKIIKQMKPGDSICFYDIIGRSQTGCDLVFPSIKIIIK